MRESFPYSDTTIIMDFIYDESGKPFAVCYSKDGGANFTPYFYATNLQGDVEGIFRVLKNGTTGLYEQKWYGRYTYDAWGNVTAYTAAGNSPGSTTLVYRNPIRYRGYVYDNETGWYYLQSRYYDPANHRFINADEAEYVLISAVNLNATNLFTYCGNNPVSNADNDGAFWDTVFDVVSLAFSVVDVISNPSDGGAWIGLAGDIIDLIPFVSGVGEAARAVNVADDILDAADDIHDAAKIADRVDDAGDALTTVGKIDNIDITVDCCFVAGTVILTENGKVPIEEIQVGDYVWAWDEESGNVALKRVEDTFIRESSELVHIYVNGEEIIATPEHPFYTPVYGWTSAAHLRAGDILVLVNGEYVVVEKIQHELLESPVKVYNFQVEDYHTYYVAEVSVLVHNSCGKTTGKFANNAEAARVADELGYKPTSSLSHGQKVYVNNKAPSDLKYISRDIDCHSGGAWKAASTIQGLGSKATRSGTYTRYLEYLCK